MIFSFNANFTVCLTSAAHATRADCAAPAQNCTKFNPACLNKTIEFSGQLGRTRKSNATSQERSVKTMCIDYGLRNEVEIVLCHVAVGRYRELTQIMAETVELAVLV